jgi:L-lysine exporter family protein LysE/ArgO
MTPAMNALSAGFLLSLSLCLDLGIVNVAILRTALRAGGMAAFLVGVGSSIGDLVYFSLSTAGATALLAWAPVRWAFWLLGTIVLLVLAFRMAREVLRPHALALDATADAPRRTPARLLGYGMSLALASPTSILWFAAVGGAALASIGSDRSQIVWLTAGFALAALLWSALLAFAIASSRQLLGAALVRALSAISALLFLYFAVRIFVDGLRDLRAVAG